MNLYRTLLSVRSLKSFFYLALIYLWLLFFLFCHLTDYLVVETVHRNTLLWLLCCFFFCAAFCAAKLLTNTSEFFCQLEVITSQWASCNPKSMLFHRILLSDVIHLSYQLFWCFVWDGCQSCHPVDSCIIVFPFSEYYHISAVFSVLWLSLVFRDSLWLNVSSGYKHLTEANYYGTHLPFSSNFVPFGPSSSSSWSSSSF